MTRLQIGLVWFIAFVSPSLHAQDRTVDVTVDDYFTLATITEVSLSPDGKYVVYSQGIWDKSDDSRKTDLWIVPTDGQHSPRKLTFDRANDRHPKWSADGDTIYFLGNRKKNESKPPYDGSTQVWKIKLTPVKADYKADVEGLDLKPVTRIEGGISSYDLAPDRNEVFYSTEKTFNDQDDFSNLRSQFNKVEYGHGVRKVSEIHKLDLQTWRSDKVVDDTRYIREFTVSRDGKRIAMVSAFDDSIVKSEGESRVDIWEEGKVVTPPTEVYRKDAASPHAWLENLTWSPDGKKFSFCAIFDAYPTEIVTGTKTDSGWKTEYIKRPKTLHVHGYGSTLKWATSNELLFMREQAGKVDVIPAIPEVLDSLSGKEMGDRVVYTFDTDAKGKSLAIVSGDSTQMGDLYFGELAPGAPLKKLTNVNDHARRWKSPSIQHITWKAPDGTEVGGILELPFGYKKGTKLPLVVAIHGGPTTAHKASLEYDVHNGRLYFSAKGYAVLLPNYRGSTGYGDKFVTDLIGNENDIEVKDILAGIQHLIQEGIADADRVGVMGWSNGGYLTNCLITLKDPPVKFKAASSGAGILDTVAEWGFNDEPAYPKVFKKGHPWEQPEIYHKTSPTYGLGNVSTPTLIHVGGGDERCPPGHSRMLYRALKEYKKVPTELVVYTGEPHGLTKLSNRKAKMEWDLAWFAKYMKK
jgi:dipeptidyl aminopeptidase/acylaminoacyl peptidase